MTTRPVSQASTKTYRVIVCGTLFGQVYLSAFQRHFPQFELSGILARGSERSQLLADRYGVPLYQNVEQLPDDIDIACVVVRSAIVGGQGSELATSLLARGIHVLQEHPVYEKDVVECLKLAREKGCQYQINTHYPTVPAVQHFIDYCQAAKQSQQPLFIEATCGVQVICGLLDILSRALGCVAPYEFYASPRLPASLHRKARCTPPYQVVQGIFAGVPLTLKIQNQLDPNDPDNHFHIMHRITIGLPSGNLMLVNTHGPVLWNRTFYIPRHETRQGVRELVDKQQAGDFYTPPLCEVIYQGSASLEEILERHWSQAIRSALRQFASQIEQPSPKTAQSLLSQAAVWKSLMSCVGNPEVIQAAAPVRTQPDIQQWLTAYDQGGQYA
ncbi:Gfo/Idh/MocA family oxidoreductase [Vreelandella alkaliphila]|uniref:Gfo/Idh/MocA family oxidoreductase n=1 Tax=Halomonadaceae TaxID=28256 RepID=UPI0018685930|nr:MULTISPECIES: Gfo/Idh/MocA family oxidoreductase [Halomonas]